LLLALLQLVEWLEGRLEDLLVGRFNGAGVRFRFVEGLRVCVEEVFGEEASLVDFILVFIVPGEGLKCGFVH
jgi:hypothetical protein